MIRAGIGLAITAGMLGGCNALASQDEQIATSVQKSGAHVATINAPALARRIARDEIRLVDVRTPEEFATGRIAGAVNMPVDGFDPAQLADADPAKVVLYCRSGRRSQIAAEKLAAATGTPAVHLEGGILAWESADQPVVR